MKGCPFCEISEGRRDAEILLETSDLLCFAPLEPETPGHTLIISREHHTSLLDAPAALGLSLLEACRLLLQRFHSSQGATGFNLLSANGAAAQQSILHLHLHFLPRRDGDGIDAWPALARLPGITQPPGDKRSDLS